MPTDEDDELLRELRAALSEAADVPPSVARTGRDLFVWRTVDAELAELTDERAGAGVLLRAGADDQRRSLTFHATALDIDVDLEPRPGSLRGLLRPAVDAAGRVHDVLVERPSEAPARTVADEYGWFAFEPFRWPGGRFRLRVGDVVTPWID